MPQAKISLADLSALDQSAFTATLADIFEHSPWVAERAWAARPFGTVDALHAAMMQAVRDAGDEAILGLLRAHPELATPGYLTAASASEQGGMGLTKLQPGEGAAFAAANRDYQAVFGFPFIIAVRGIKNSEAIRRAMEARLRNDAAVEREVALQEVGRISRFRLDDLIAAP